MSKTLSNEQIHVIKTIMDLNSDLDNRIRLNIEETFLRKELDTETIITVLESMQDSLKYVIDDKISSLITYFKC